MIDETYAVITIIVKDDEECIDIIAKYSAPNGRCRYGEEVAKLIKLSLQDISVALQQCEDKLNVSEMN